MRKKERQLVLVVDLVVNINIRRVQKGGERTGGEGDVILDAFARSYEIERQDLTANVKAWRTKQKAKRKQEWGGLRERCDGGK